MYFNIGKLMVAKLVESIKEFNVTRTKHLKKKTKKLLQTMILSWSLRLPLSG